jgi:2,3-bisphosphoglycerate-independent phosphoglycerate mutase
VIETAEQDVSVILQALVRETPSKTLLLVCDGLGGLPDRTTGRTELESATTPNLDALARRSDLGVAELIARGITPGSGPGHLAIFGYDPLSYQIGRGALTAVGCGFALGEQDVAARLNFCSLDPDGRILDRRAGRLPSGEAARLATLLEARVRLPGVEVFVRPEAEYRGVLVLRGAGLSEQVTDTDPQRSGGSPLPARPSVPSAEAERTATLVNDFVAQARQILRDERPANGVLLRGFARASSLPAFVERYRLRSAAVAAYPTYRAIAQLVGMEVLPAGSGLSDQIEALQRHWAQFDFFFLHVKDTDIAAESGDFAAKVRAIEAVDQHVPQLLALKPDVFAITGDHTTPSVLQAHSWHPVPFCSTHAGCCRLRPRGSPSGTRSGGASVISRCTRRWPCCWRML